MEEAGTTRCRVLETAVDDGRACFPTNLPGLERRRWSTSSQGTALVQAGRNIRWGCLAADSINRR